MISFDRIASTYDVQRAYPPGVARQIGHTIMELAGPDARVLELGVGTGRIAQPVGAAGGQVVGIDVSWAMLHQAYHHGMELLVQGDAQCLPFASHTYDAVLAVHVLHLLDDWRAALAETVRVLRPGGVVLQGRDWRDPQSCVGQLRAMLRNTLIALQPGIRPPGAGAAVGQALHKLGCVPEPDVIAAHWQSTTNPAAVLQNMAARHDAETWALPADLLDAALERVGANAAELWSDLDAPQPVEQQFIISVARRVASSAA